MTPDVRVSERVETCGWHREDPDWNVWRGDCGGVWELNDGTPADNKMAFCPYCGGSLRFPVPEEGGR